MSADLSIANYTILVISHRVRLVFIREGELKGAVWAKRGWGEKFVLASCGTHVSSQSLLACYVSPHSSCLISREKLSASGQAQGLSEDILLCLLVIRMFHIIGIV